MEAKKKKKNILTSVSKEYERENKKLRRGREGAAWLY